MVGSTLSLILMSKLRELRLTFVVIFGFLLNHYHNVHIQTVSLSRPRDSILKKDAGRILIIIGTSKGPSLSHRDG